MDIHFYIFNKWKIRYGYRMDTSTQAVPRLTRLGYEKLNSGEFNLLHL